MKTQVPNNISDVIRAPNAVYADPPPASDVYDGDPGHLREAPWQAHLDTRYGVLTRSFSQFRSASEADRRTIGQLFEVPKYESHAAQLAAPKTKTAAAPDASLGDQVYRLLGRR